MTEEFDPKIEQAIETVYFETDSINKKILEYSFGLYETAALTQVEILSKLNLEFKEFINRELSLIEKINSLI